MSFGTVYKIFLILPVLAFAGRLQGQDDYFWVGGTGNWSELDHWATTSGGGIYHIEIPASDDNVIFDQNSFTDSAQVVYITVGNAVCKNMSWNDVPFMPTLLGADTLQLRIYGSLKLSAQMDMQFKGTISFEATTAGNTIETGQHWFVNDVFFKGSGGGWTLLDSLKVANPDPFLYSGIYFNNGTLITNGQTVICETFTSVAATNRLLDIRYSEFNVVGTYQASGAAYKVEAVPSTINCGEFFIHEDGSYLVFDNINLLGLFSGLINSNIKSKHNTVHFYGSGLVEGTFNIDSLIFEGAMDSCLVNGTDTFNVAQFKFPSRLMGTNSIVHEALFEAGGKLTGHGNQVDNAIFSGKGLVTGTNHIAFLYFKTKGIIDVVNNIDNAVFGSDGEIWGRNTFGNLTFSPGFSYLFENDSTQTILNSFSLTGTCEEPILITSDVNTAQAVIFKAGGGVQGDYLFLRDIRASGPGIPFIAGNSIDLGNNTNWTIQPISTGNRYWVGGTGNWDEDIHWSASSGGPGGECPPTPLDNVFFDGNSFPVPDQSVTINVKNAYCRDMTWTGAANNPSFEGIDTNNLRIYGSLKFIDAMEQQFGGHAYFESTETGKTVEMAGNVFFKNSYFQGRFGGWTLQDGFQTSDTLYFLHGHLNTNGQKVDCNNFNSVDTTTRILTLDTSTVQVYQPQADAWYINGINLEFHGEKSLIRALGNPEGHVRSDNSALLQYNNVELYGMQSQLKNYAICRYNLVTFFGPMSESNGNCSIDTLTFKSSSSLSRVLSSDSINAVMSYGFMDTIAGGMHIIKSAHFFNDGFVYGMNKMDTLVFHDFGIMTQLNTVQVAKFLDNGEIYGRNTFGELDFVPGKKYLFEHDSTQTITDTWKADGTCTGSIIIQSDKPGQRAFVKKANNNVVLDYISLRDMHGLSSGPTFTANNSVDLGNNVNWTINQASPLALYWVNGTGNWDDPNHWAAYSGGPGGYCLPKEIDDVYFDKNSFPGDSCVVSVNVDNAVCNSMFWMGSDKSISFFAGGDTSTLTVYGSLIFNDSVTNQFQGEVFFEDLGLKGGPKAYPDTIRTFNKGFRNNVYFQGIGDEWKLLDDFQGDANVYLVHGSLVVGKHRLNCNRFLSSNDNIRSLNISNSTISLYGLNTDAFLLDMTNLVLTADNSLIRSMGFGANIKTVNGNMVKLHNIKALAPNVGVLNSSNHVSYNVVDFQADLGLIKGDFTADTILFKGMYCSMKEHSQTNFVFVYGSDGSIDGFHTIDTAVFYAYGFINNNNYIHDCTFHEDGKIFGTNNFDNLTFSPGGTYELQAQKTQTVTNEFRIRGNNCFGITMRSTSAGNQAIVTKPGGDVSGDFLELRDINATGGANFYAGALSEDLGNNSGWIFDNSPGYIYGFGDVDLHFCHGTDFAITTENFNGTQSTQYYWGNPPSLGADSLSITEPGVYQLVVVYGTGTDTCSIADEVNVVMDLPPVVSIADDPYCEGEIIGLDVFPRSNAYTYLWFDQTTGPSTIATLGIQDSVWIEVTDPVTGCVTKTGKAVTVIETPKPEYFLGNDTTLKFGTTVILNAGPGSYYQWYADNSEIVIEHPNDPSVTVGGMPEPVTYTVEVENEGCMGSGSILIGEFPQCAADVPNAFSPNGDGINDILYVRAAGLSEFIFRLYNRYGDLVFETDDQEVGWDGITDSGKQEAEVYTYYLKAICADSGLIEKTGNITLLR
jgi:gliding motility-associated-like protein